MKVRMRVIAAALVAGVVLFPASSALAQDATTILPGEPSTASQESEPTVPPPEGLVSVVDVRVGTHDGFDRLVFELVGDGTPGYRIAYTDEPVGDASGLPVEVAGATALQVTLVGVAIPGEEPEGATTFLDDVLGPDGGVILEVVNESLFEGYHTFFVGLDEQLPFVLGLLDDPTRLVVDLVHTTEGETEEGTEAGTEEATEPGTEEETEAGSGTEDVTEVPSGGVEAGEGAATSPIGPIALGLGGLLVLVGVGLLVRHRIAA
jgi:hypothetical protein